MQVARAYKRGFSLIEILIFISVFASVFIIILGIISYSTILMKNAEYRTFATYYADELVQWMRYQRDSLGYTELESRSGTYCFNSAAISDTWPSTGSCASYSLDSFFMRELEFSGDDDQLAVEVRVSWLQFGASRNNTVQFYLTNKN